MPPLKFENPIITVQYPDHQGHDSLIKILKMCLSPTKNLYGRPWLDPPPRNSRQIVRTYLSGIGAISAKTVYICPYICMYSTFRY